MLEDRCERGRLGDVRWRPSSHRPLPERGRGLRAARNRVMTEDSDRLIEAGTPTFRRATLALFAAGFSTFAVLYGVQPLLPIFADTFAVSPAESKVMVLMSTEGIRARSCGL